MGLLGGIAKTAVVAGTSQATRNAVNRRQAKRNVRAYSQAQQPVQGQQVVYASPPPAATASQDDTIAQLERLGALKNQGVLTEEEFQAQKAKILGQ
jgi:RNase P protein component